MAQFEDLPRRPKNHEIESRAEAAFVLFLDGLEDCHLQKSDRKDYGTDCEIEVVHDEMATNVRLHVQLKGTEQEKNTDGSISVGIERANLNYLLMQPFSSFVCFHVPSQTLWMRASEDVLREYERSGRDWSAQKTLTVRFSEQLTPEHFSQLAAGARATATGLRNDRITHSTSAVADLPGILGQSVPELHVGSNPERAMKLLNQLYESGADRLISASFTKFEAVLGAEHDGMGLCYMAEVNLGMAGIGQDERVASAIEHFRSRIGTGRFLDASLTYSIGNALSALGKEDEAAVEYREALTGLKSYGDIDLVAQCHKNLGSSLERLGNEEGAVTEYREALRLSPNLAEAHHALASYHHRNGDYEQALEHFDKVVFLNDAHFGKQASVSGWRLNALFQVGDIRGAFRDINSLLREANHYLWIWPWCARQVAIFGRTSVESAKQALRFWQQYLQEHPSDIQGKREELLARLFLRSSGEDPGLSFGEIKQDLDLIGDEMEADELAFLWDRLGHWAQDNGDWSSAEMCFRRAFDLAGRHYGYCLGTALSFLERYEESLPILQAQAEKHQPDAMSWFQVAVAHEKLGQTDQSINAYRKAIELDPDYDLAWFNLGGLYWNSEMRDQAVTIWKQAVAQFPDHELAAKLQSEIPFVFR